MKLTSNQSGYGMVSALMALAGFATFAGVYAGSVGSSTQESQRVKTKKALTDQVAHLMNGIIDRGSGEDCTASLQGKPLNGDLSELYVDSGSSNTNQNNAYSSLVVNTTRVGSFELSSIKLRSVASSAAVASATTTGYTPELPVMLELGFQPVPQPQTGTNEQFHARRVLMVKSSGITTNSSGVVTDMGSITRCRAIKSNNFLANSCSSMVDTLKADPNYAGIHAILDSSCNENTASILNMNLAMMSTLCYFFGGNPSISGSVSANNMFMGCLGANAQATLLSIGTAGSIFNKPVLISAAPSLSTLSAPASQLTQAQLGQAIATIGHTSTGGQVPTYTTPPKSSGETLTNAELEEMSGTVSNDKIDSDLLPPIIIGKANNTGNIIYADSDGGAGTTDSEASVIIQPSDGGGELSAGDGGTIVGKP